MNAINYYSIRIIDIKESKTWSSISSETIERSLQPIYDKNDIKKHKCQINILKLFFYYNSKNLIKNIFTFTLMLTLNFGLALIYPKLILFLISKFNHNTLFTLNFGLAYLWSLFVLLILWALIKLPGNITNAINFQLKKDSYKKRGRSISKFKESEYDKEFKIVKEEEWDKFSKNLI